MGKNAKPANDRFNLIDRVRHSSPGDGGSHEERRRVRGLSVATQQEEGSPKLPSYYYPTQMEMDFESCNTKVP
jgi:hypothetical protein